MTLPTVANNADFSSKSAIGNMERIHDQSLTPAEDTETASQKRRPDRKSSGSVKKAKMSVPDPSDAMEPATTVASTRNARRTTARGVSSKSGNDPEARRTSSRRVPEIWSAEYLLANPKSKLVRCNLNVIARQIPAVHVTDNTRT